MLLLLLMFGRRRSVVSPGGVDAAAVAASTTASTVHRGINPIPKIMVLSTGCAGTIASGNVARWPSMLSVTSAGSSTT